MASNSLFESKKRNSTTGTRTRVAAHRTRMKTFQPFLTSEPGDHLRGERADPGSTSNRWPSAPLHAFGLAAASRIQKGSGFLLNSKFWIPCSSLLTREPQRHRAEESE